VLGQAYSAAWRASCDGRELGAPQPVDGYAMAWDVPADCRVADVWFGPDRTVRLGYAISAPVLLALLALLLLRRPPPPRSALVGTGVGPPVELPSPRPARMGAARAAVVALAVGAVLAFVFALRAGPPIAVTVFLVLWRGIGPGPLVAGAAALLVVVVPVLTLAVPVPNRGGYNPEYALERLPVHWVVVAAFVLLLLALVRVLSLNPPIPAARSRGRATLARSQTPSDGVQVNKDQRAAQVRSCRGRGAAEG
jgi:arabinofuranan 3-O-arabinosyltransferase